MVEIVPALTSAQRREFVDCAWPLNQGHAAWVPPLRSDQLRALDPARGDYFRHGNSGALFLALRDGRIAGRIAAFRNEAHLRTHRDNAGFFGFFECADDAEVARCLLAEAESWLKRAGLNVARGPANFNVQEEAGVLLDGFDLSPMIGMNWTPPHHRRLVEAAGYAKAKDLHVLRINRAELKPDRFDRMAAAAERVSGVRVRQLDLGNLASEGKFMETIFAEAWRDNWGMVPISAAEFRETYERYRLFISPELVLLAEIDGEPAGMMVALPDMNVLVRRIGGRLWPFGWLRLLLGRGSVNRYRLMALGVRPKFRRTGLPLIFFTRLRAELLKRGAELLEGSWVLEDNHEVIGVVTRLGGWRAQTLRLYEKKLG